MTVHRLSLREEFYDAVANGIKAFEVRKADRDYKVGDTLLMTLSRDTGRKALATGKTIYEDEDIYEIVAVITYILTHDMYPEGVPEGYVILSISVKDADTNRCTHKGTRRMQ